MFKLYLNHFLAHGYPTTVASFSLALAQCGEQFIACIEIVRNLDLTLTPTGDARRLVFRNRGSFDQWLTGFTDNHLFAGQRFVDQAGQAAFSIVLLTVFMIFFKKSNIS